MIVSCCLVLQCVVREAMMTRIRRRAEAVAYDVCVMMCCVLCVVCGCDERKLFWLIGEWMRKIGSDYR